MKQSALLPEVADFIREKAQPQVELDADLKKRLLFPELEATLQPLHTFTRLLNPVEAVEPRNAAEEREKFLKAFEDHGFNTSQVANPVFRYRRYESLDIGDIRRQLEAIRVAVKQIAATDIPLEGQLGCALAVSKLDDDLDTIEIIEGLADSDEPRVRQAVESKYGALSTSALSLAHQTWQRMLLPKAPVAVEGKFTAEQRQLLCRPLLSAINIAAALYWGLTQYGLGEVIDVVITPEATSIDVRDKNSSGRPTIVVPARYNAPENFYTGKQVLSLLAHEVSAHVRQSANGWQLLGFGGGIMKTDNETLYEGLAKANDEEFEIAGFGTASEPLPYAILGLDIIAQGGDFGAVFQDNFNRRLELNPKADQRKTAGLAYTTTQRLFRGCAGFTKDMAYLYGHTMVKQLRTLGYGQYVELAGFGVKELPVLARLSAPADNLSDLLPYPEQVELPFVYWEKHLHSLLTRKAVEYDRQHEVIAVSTGEKVSWWSRFWHRLTNS